MTKHELIEKLADQIPELKSLGPNDLERIMQTIREYALSQATTADSLEEYEIDLIGDDIPDLALPKERRRMKANRIIHRPDPHWFHPPDEDDLLYDDFEDEE